MVSIKDELENSVGKEYDDTLEISIDREERKYKGIDRHKDKNKDELESNSGYVSEKLNDLERNYKSSLESIEEYYESIRDSFLLSQGKNNFGYNTNFEIIEVPRSFFWNKFGRDALGATNKKGKIWIDQALSGLKRKYVLLHEKIHNWFKYLGESGVVRKTKGIWKRWYGNYKFAGYRA